MTTATLPQSTTTCRRCGQVFAYEPLMIGTIDFGKTLNLHCQDCAEIVEAAAKANAAAARAAAIEAAIIAKLEPDLLDTDLGYPTFNRGLWEFVSKWRPSKEALWLGIVGQAGQSKTRCMTLLAQKAMRAGIRVTWVTAIGLFDATGDRKGKSDHTRAVAREYLDDCMSDGWLFLDDLGKNEWSQAFESQLFKILDYRKNKRLPVVFSSNAHPSAFSQVISPLNSAPIIGRLLERTTLLDLLAD